MADRSKEPTAMTDAELVAAAAVDAAAAAAEPEPEPDPAEVGTEPDPSPAFYKAAAEAEWEAAVREAQATVVEIRQTADADRFQTRILIQDAAGVVHEFDVPAGADLEAFKRDHLAVVTHRYRVRNVPGTP